jgi:hypothetical protein
MSKINGASCEQDRECLSGTCSNDGACVDGPDVFHQIHPWLWGVLATAIVIFVFIILGTLWILHRYQSKKEHEKIVSFFGANEEFAKYAMIEDNDSYSDEMRTHSPYNDSHTSLVYLTTPDYATSQALCTNRTKNTNRPSSGQNDTYN